MNTVIPQNSAESNTHGGMKGTPRGGATSSSVCASRRSSPACGRHIFPPRSCQTLLCTVDGRRVTGHTSFFSEDIGAWRLDEYMPAYGMTDGTRHWPRTILGSAALLKPPNAPCYLPGFHANCVSPSLPVRVAGSALSTSGPGHCESGKSLLLLSVTSLVPD